MRPNCAAALLLLAMIAGAGSAGATAQQSSGSPPNPPAAESKPYLNVNGAGASAAGSVSSEEPLPATTPGLLGELAKRSQAAAAMLGQGNLDDIWYPAIRAKDIGLALEENHLGEVAQAQRPKMESAVKRLTLSAWQIDDAADLGDEKLVRALFRNFSAAIAEIQSAYGSR